MPKKRVAPTTKSTAKEKTSSEVKALTYSQRSLVLARPSPQLNAVCLALTLQAKNLYNTAHFAVNNVLTAYLSDGERWVLKPDLHENQLIAIERFNAAVTALNSARIAKHAVAVERAKAVDEEAPLLVSIPLLSESADSVFLTVLNPTVLDNVLRTWPGLDGGSVYRRLPSAAAQMVVWAYRAAWAGYFERLSTFKAGGDKAAALTGRPKPPGYLHKKSRYVFELPLTQIGAKLTGLGDRLIPTDFEESLALTETELDAWNSYRIRDEVRRVCTKRGFGELCTVQHLRIVPRRSGVMLEVVVRVPRTIPPNSLLAQTEAAYDLPSANAERDALLLSILAEQAVPAAGIDFGVTNTAAVAYSTGHRAQLISAGRLEAVLHAFDRKLDSRISELMTSELRDLQKRKEELWEKGEKLSRSDDVKMRKGLSSLYADEAYQNLRGKRERWLKDYIHKLSAGIIRDVLARGVQVLVLGQNKGWKVGSNQGRVQNRRFGRAPIGRIIEMLRYKGEAAGLVVVATEESYTSKTSFVDNEELKVYGKKNKLEEAKEEEIVQQAHEAAATPPQSATADALKPAAPRGKRLKHDRHTFVNLYQTGRWAKVHADVNAAFNMLRKVFKGFAYSAKVTLKYTVLRVSPRLGLTPARI